MLDFDTCYAAIERRDASQNGQWFFGVLTTGVYCRPSCPARLPLKKNVRFYQTPQQAEADGLRACLRCRPLATVGADPNMQRVTRLCEFIEAHAQQTLSLAALASEAGLSPFHLQRSFKAITGVSPKQFQQSVRMKRLKASLREGEEATNAIFDAGYGSLSRVYEQADTRLGMTPIAYRNGGANMTITHVTVESPVGPMMIGATDRGLCFIQFADDVKDLTGMLQKEYPNAELIAMEKPYPPSFDSWMEALNNHLCGHQPHLDLPLDIRATAFQLKVWHYLQMIPCGQVQSYSEVAAGIGQPTAARAVARACASNKIALAIPCHRVIRGTGELGGYRWGIERKRVIIDRERRFNKVK